MSSGTLIRREHRRDKEFHFQDWFSSRLHEAGVNFDDVRRLTYPDFSLVHFAEAYEVKGLAWPGRWANFDANSQVPTGFHNGRDVYYVFGRYPAGATEAEFPVIDLVICHGSFLNAHHDYIHENRSFRGFGSYGDIMIRDRKMYVAPTPFAITTGIMGQRTLILPSSFDVGEGLVSVGELVRVESDELVAGYSFDLETNILTPQFVANPSAGREHQFVAYRTRASGVEVALTDHPSKG